MVSGVYWSAGGRAENEDSLALEEIGSNRGNMALAVVSDGIATLDCGECASGYITECMVKWFYRYGVNMRHASYMRIKRSLRRAVYDCHMELAEYCRENGLRMGATCSLVCIWKGRFVCMNLGDSAVFLLKRDRFSGYGNPGSRIKRLTRVQTNEKGELTAALSSIRFDEPEFTKGRLGSGWSVLAASDGFFNRTGMDELAEMLMIEGKITPERIEHRLAGIGSETARRGGSDNRSAVLITG